MKSIVSVFFSVLIFSACAIPSKEELKFKHYMIEGRNVYISNCSNCHGEEGKGLGRLYPPLAGSDYLENDYLKSLCIIKYGIKGELEVNGQIYNQLMPTNPKLTDLEISEVATYISNSWGNKFRIIEVNEAAELLEKCNN